MPASTPHRAEWLIENPKDGTLLVLVPAGKFFAGGSMHYEGNCDPFWVELPAYYLALHPVTNAQYKRFLDETGRPPPPRSEIPRQIWKADMRPEDAFPDDLAQHPVVHVTWRDASDYCDWAGLRLLSELEWEKGSRGVDGRTFPWGEEWDPAYCQNDISRKNELTCNVWRYPRGASVWGCYQMSGNVWEWCADWYSASSYKRYARGRLEPPREGSSRVVRGGAWFNATRENYQSCYRLGNEPDQSDGHYGFRAALDAGRRPARRRR